jgi:hypothetical protein
MIKVTLSGDRQVLARIRGMTDKLRPRLVTAMKLSLYKLRELAREEYDRAGLHVRTGALKGSIEVAGIETSSNTISGSVVAGQRLPYARAQEYGAIIRPTHSRFLAIPIGEALTERGIARFRPRDIVSQGGYTGTFFKGNVLFGKRGKGVAVPLFALKRSVTIPARPFMRPALIKVRPVFEQYLRMAVSESLR